MPRIVLPMRKPTFGSVQVDRSDPIARGLIACWLFNEPGGTKVYDLSGFNHHGQMTSTLANITRTVSTKSGGRCIRDATAGNADSVALDTVFSFGPAFTIDMMVRLATTGDGVHGRTFITDDTAAVALSFAA